MHHDKQVVVRMPAGLADRLDRLVPQLAADPHLAAAGRVTRSMVARLALMRGLQALEDDRRATAGEVG